MFSIANWLETSEGRDRNQELYRDILSPQLWEMGKGEAEALDVKRERWQRLETYWLFQPSSRDYL